MSPTQPHFEFNALDTARLLRALSWSDLADKALLSRAAIAKIRKGAQPTEDTVAALSEALAFPSAYFFTTPPPPPSNGVLHYRKKARAPKKRISQLMAHATVFNKLVEHLAQQPGFPRDQMRHGDSNDIEAAAAACRQAWGIGAEEPITHACAAIERAGALVATFDAEDIAVDGFSWRHPVKRRAVPLIMYYRHSAPSRVRFSLLHEAGHLVLHHQACDGDEHKEREASHFAGAMLLPAEPFMANFPRRGDRLDWDGLLALKQHWGVSLQAIILRAKELGIIGAATYRWAFVHINQRGWKRQEPGEPDEAEAPAALKALVDSHCQRQSISQAQLADTLALPESMIERLLTA